jgi:hypothetical protein
MYIFWRVEKTVHLPGRYQRFDSPHLRTPN